MTLVFYFLSEEVAASVGAAVAIVVVALIAVVALLVAAVPSLAASSAAAVSAVADWHDRYFYFCLRKWLHWWVRRW